MHRESRTRRPPWGLALTLVLLVLVGVGCSAKPDDAELLLVYSGDCKGYIEPCG